VQEEATWIDECMTKKLRCLAYRVGDTSFGAYVTIAI
jgi:hypothetical protein